MRVCAIIAEYNPLHTGHIYQINKVKQFADAIVIILTGAITQRGEFSIFNKWTKTKAALLSGANLVLELPTIFACSCAEKFAHAAIQIIKKLKFVTDISFGSEIGDVNEIIKVAKICKNIDKTQEMKYFLKQGHSYPKARCMAIGKQGDILKYPNNLLAIEYVKACLNLNCKILFHTVKRMGANHNATKTSATASSFYIRNNINNLEIIKKFIPEKLLYLYKDPIIIPDNFVFNSLRQSTKDQFLNLPDTTEGLYNRLFKISKKATSLDQFFEMAKTKRYVLTRLKRIAMYSFFNIEKQKIKSLPQYSQVLGFDFKGQKLLASCKNQNFLFTTNFKKIYHNFPYSANLDSKATDFTMLFEKNPKPCNLNFKRKPIII